MKPTLFSLNKLQKDKTFIWHPFDVFEREANIFIKKATGVYLQTHDGRKIIDAISSWWVNIHGHRNPDMIKAVSKQLRYLEHVIFAGFTHEPAIKLAESLLKIVPNSLKKVFFSDNGSTSTEVAIKLAIQYWYNKNEKKTKILAFEGAYHGDTFGAMSVGARDGFNKPFERYLFDVTFIPLPNAENIEKILSEIDNLALQNDIAAFIYEPMVQGSAGMRMYESQYLELILKKTAQYQIINIADEVFTGFGRTGKAFASDYCETQPDILCLSKALTGGYLPLGATLCNQSIVDAFTGNDIYKLFLHGHSYTGNALACAAGAESVRLFNTSQCKADMERVKSHFENWKAELQNHDMVKEIRVLGCIFAVELQSELATHYNNPLREIIYDKFLAKNILIRPLGNVLYVLPPYVISDKELHYIFKSIKEVLQELNSKS